MQNITFLVNSLSSGGAEKVLSVLVTELVKQNYAVEIIFLEKNDFYELPKEIKRTYLSSFTGNESGLKKLIFLPIFSWKLMKYIQKQNIKLIQSHLYRANYVNILAKLFGTKHSVQIVNHGIISIYKLEGILGKINLLLIRCLYKHANLIIWISQVMQLDANKLFKFKTKELVINNPYNIKSIQNLSTQKTDFYFDKNKVYIVSIGSLISLKRNKDLIKAIAKVSKNIEILFLGDGDEKKNLVDLVNKLGVIKRVYFLGNVSNPYKYLSKCDIFVHTSKTEGFSNVLIEAMICGLPVISSDCGGPREILAPNSSINKKLNIKNAIEMGEFGVLYAVGDVANLVEAINSMVKYKELRKQYASKGLERAEDFSVEKIVQMYKKELQILKK